MAPASDDITTLLRRWSEGDGAALEQVLPLVYAHLKALAGAYIGRERPGHTLQATALVHETYLRLAKGHLHAESRAQFLGLCAHLMRRILVDHARRRGAGKRGAGQGRLSLDEQLVVPVEREALMVDLDDALNELASMDERQARMVELRFFGGMTVEETAEVLGVSPATVKREWAMARAWLHRRLDADAP